MSDVVSECWRVKVTVIITVLLFAHPKRVNGVPYTRLLKITKVSLL